MRFFAVLALLGGSTVVFSQDTPVQDEGDVAPAAGDAALSVEQGRLADRFKRLEEVLARLAELSASSDPRRARLLREAISQSREQDINVRFDAIVSLLENERLSAAAQNQTELQKELDSLLNLLLKADRDKELASERDRVRKYLKEVGRLIRMQRGVRARTEGGDEFGGLKQDQQRIATDTGKLGGEIHQTEVDRKPSDEPASKDKEPEGDENTEGGQADDSDGKPSKSGEQSKSNDASKPGKSSEKNASQSSKPQSGSGKSSDKSEPSKSSPSQPGEPQQSQSGQPSQGGESADEQSSQQPTDPADRATQRLRAAAEQMEQAQKKLEEAQRKGAADRQREAVRELEQAKAELERILRQLREEELERTLTQLVARFRKMLESQIVVYEGTLRLNSVPTAERDHDEEIEAARLSRQELQIVQEADKALLLLREEGSSIAFPEAVEQMRDDMRLVAEWLGAAKVGPITQGVEAEIITALEEVIAALEKARKDLEKNRTPPGQPGAAGQPTEPTLVHKLAELKMIRALQMRINQRTKRFGEMIEGEQAETADLLEALRQLAERQERVYKATADLEQGRND
ncbi:MAG TPA: hypothetical protein VJ828_10710 [Lacipirellulaceae bacterium]|nr:hypothetical protein [Lacipirellulaceae bacterium]